MHDHMVFHDFSSFAVCSSLWLEDLSMQVMRLIERYVMMKLHHSALSANS